MNRRLLPQKFLLKALLRSLEPVYISPDQDQILAFFQIEDLCNFKAYAGTTAGYDCCQALVLSCCSFGSQGLYADPSTVFIIFYYIGEKYKGHNRGAYPDATKRPAKKIALCRPFLCIYTFTISKVFLKYQLHFPKKNLIFLLPFI